jgi:hypothetical protein
MDSGTKGAAAGLVGGAVKGYQFAKEWQRWQKQDELDKMRENANKHGAARNSTGAIVGEFKTDKDGAQEYFGLDGKPGIPADEFSTSWNTVGTDPSKTATELSAPAPKLVEPEPMSENAFEMGD